MYFMINEEELGALCGLPHIQQLAYLRGIRPYMNVKTCLVGIERGISYQSIAEQLYVEPHQGIKSSSFSRAQIRRALAGLERAGLIQFQSEEKQLILKCNLAITDYCAQKKAVTNPSSQPVPVDSLKSIESTGFSGHKLAKADTGEQEKAVLPHNLNNNYLFLYTHFNQFWAVYPNKKSQQKAWQEFQKINPNESLVKNMLDALTLQIQQHEALQDAGHWVPNWKNPANWLAQHCWNDELTPVTTLEQNHAKNARYSTKKSPIEHFSESCSDAPFEFEEDPKPDTSSSNIVQFRTA
ncbi:Vir protein [Legionella longbeachae]|uniref:Vir protein n=1 Tax=Legionella longbeachae TaxID=450 RepID=UPI0009B785D7|nr:Vir protein [Legionella longbeachae]VEE02713.1 Legionella vir region protein [Legionella oakridgensis]